MRLFSLIKPAFLRRTDEGVLAPLVDTMATVLWLLMLCSLPASLEVRAADVSPDQTLVQEILKRQCTKCHGPLHGKGELNLSTLRGLARGGESGAVVVPGRPDESLLLSRIIADEMPPDEPLNEADKNVLRQWIESGAAGLPQGELPDPVAYDHWAFQKLQKPVPPVVADPATVRNAIDQFVIARLEAHRLDISAEASRNVLIRRVCFDLTGLPPTLAEIQQFSDDRSADAYEQIVERYLASPRYGERWGQYWLDAAGYADSSGYFSDEKERPLAWRYRDYVIDSFHRNKPFNEFVREQIAGDELFDFAPDTETSPENLARLIATHYLRNAPDGTDNSAPNPDAQRIDRFAVLEGTQQVVASSLLGLSLKCARCHDHKFEPISQKEYYQVQAIFAPAFNHQQWLAPLQRKIRVPLQGEIAAWKESQAQLEIKIATARRQRAETAKFLASQRERGIDKFRADFSNHDLSKDWHAFNSVGPVAFGGDSTPVAAGQATTPENPASDGTLKIVAPGERTWLATKQLFDWTPEHDGDWIQVTFQFVNDRLAIADGQAMRIGFCIAMQAPRSGVTDLGGSVLIDGNPTGVTQLFYDPAVGKENELAPNFGEAPYQVDREYGVRVTRLADDKYQLDHLVDFQIEGTSTVLTAAQLPNGFFAFYRGNSRSFIVDDVLIEEGSQKTVQPVASDPKVQEQSNEAQKRRTAIETEIKQLESQRTVSPGAEIAWLTDVSAAPPQVFLLKRGGYDSPGDEVQPSALAVLSDADNEFKVAEPSAAVRTTGRRLALANWLTKPDSRAAALVAHTQVNQVWLHHFGRGFVATADNFGLSGAAPTHFELLEYLAATFAEQNWNIKDLHRLILTSATYRQGSTASVAAVEGDPDNRQFSRFPLQRLSGEAIRDAMLAASGELDLQAGGPPVPFDRGGRERSPLNREIVINESTAGAQRRSIYLEHWRTRLPTMLSLFDTPNLALNCLERTQSTVPLQSLVQLNSDFARQRGKAMAARLRRESDGKLESMVDLAYQFVSARMPNPDERQDAIGFIEAVRPLYPAEHAETQAMADFCQMLMNSNVFLYVE